MIDAGSPDGGPVSVWTEREQFMARKLFGTDGIRGKANKFPMTADVALKVAMATGVKFHRGDHRHKVIIGKDTRLSGYMLESALVAGFTSMGMDVVLVGPLPTPAIAMLTRSMRADLGVMISASHNPYQDNGIKLFGPDGFKMSDDVEAEIETMISAGNFSFVPSEDIGRAVRMDDARGRYIEHVKNSFPKDLSLDGFKIVVDCAHGAAYNVAPKVFYELGAEVVPMGVSPNGKNINLECGATATRSMCEQVILHGADLGIALDGDADRLIMCDAEGSVIDGDQLIGLIASYWQEQGLLKGDGAVTTVMSNLGLERHLESQNLKLHRTAVGDRYVVEKMRAGGYNVGGEQSGHIVLSDYGTTGDGIVAALQVLAVLARSKKTIAEACSVFETVPQKLINVRYEPQEGQPTPLETFTVQDAIEKGRQRLVGKGRLVIRKSGTEPLIRVMGECDDAALLEDVLQSIVSMIQEASQKG